MSVQRISVFPLAGVILFPGLQLPLHIFEQRYRAMIGDAMARDRKIGMIQPRDHQVPPTLYETGCLGRIADIEALEDGRYNLVLEGVARFRMLRELDVTTPFRQIEAEVEDSDQEAEDFLASAERAALEAEARKFAEARGYAVDWDAVGQLDDRSLVNGIAQIAPFDHAAKQAMLEIDGLAERSELIIQLMQFFGRTDDEGGRATLQ